MIITYHWSLYRVYQKIVFEGGQTFRPIQSHSLSQVILMVGWAWCGVSSISGEGFSQTFCLFRMHYVFAFARSHSHQVVHQIYLGNVIIFTPLTCVFFAIMHRLRSVNFFLQISQEKDDFFEGS